MFRGFGTAVPDDDDSSAGDEADDDDKFSDR